MGPRILVVNVNWLGDVLFSTPAIRALRKKFPQGHIACLVPPRCKGLLENNPYLDEVITCEDQDPFLFAVAKSFGLIRELKKRRFDTAIFFHSSKTKVFLTWLCGIPERAGFWAPYRQWLLTRTCSLPEGPIHRTDVFLQLLEKLGVPDDGRAPDFFPNPAAEAELKALFRKHGVQDGSPYMVVHPGGNWDLKRWPVRYFVEWIRLFLSEHPWKVVLCGTAGEEDLSRAIQSHFRSEEVISLCGRTSLDALALLLKNARFLLSNDSGPIHLAASQGTRIVGLFGPTSPALTGPLSRGDTLILRKDVGCEIPCYFRSCDTRVCMEWLTPEEVCKQTKEFLAR